MNNYCNELKLQIISFLNADDLTSLSQINRTWNSLLLCPKCGMSPCFHVRYVAKFSRVNRPEYAKSYYDMYLAWQYYHPIKSTCVDTPLDSDAIVNRVLRERRERIAESYSPE